MASSFAPVKIKSVLSLQSKNIILNVHDALVHQHPVSSVRELVTLCSTMTGAGEATIYRLLKQRKDGHLYEPKKPSGRKLVETYQDYKDVVRRKVHSFYFKNEIPTLDKILTSIKDDESLPDVKRTKLWNILKELNFCWEKQNRKSLLIEKEEIIIWRRQYLRDIKELRRQNKEIFYLDETWINEGHAPQKIWIDKEIKSSRQAFLEGLSTGLKIPSGKGRRLIITHIGSSKGFVNGGLLEFESKSTKDYHEEMTADVFEEYFSQMIELLPNDSVIVMDNASYHSRLVEKLPTSSWKKSDIVNWLTEKQIPFESDMVKKELLVVVRQHKLKFKKFVVDEIAKQRGITVLRLPPYHCELNPIELIWAQVKGDVARNNTTFKLSDVRALLNASLQKIEGENWRKAVDHAIKEEEKMWKLDNLVDQTIEPLVIDVGLSDDSSDLSESDFH